MPCLYNVTIRYAETRFFATMLYKCITYGYLCINCYEITSYVPKTVKRSLVFCEETSSVQSEHWVSVYEQKIFSRESFCQRHDSSPWWDVILHFSGSGALFSHGEFSESVHLIILKVLNIIFSRSTFLFLKTTIF